MAKKQKNWQNSECWTRLQREVFLTELLYNIVQDKLRVPKIGDHSPIPSLSLDLCSTSTHVVLPTSCTYYCQCYHCTINVGAY